MTKFIHGVVVQAPHNDVFPVEISPPENTKVEVKKLVSLQQELELLYIDGRIGNRLLPFHGPIDLAFFKRYHRFEVGTITSEEPLRIYLQVFGNPAMFPWSNFTVVGEMSDWEAPAFDQKFRIRVREIDLGEFEQWIRDHEISDRDAVLEAATLLYLECHLRK